ncbi:DUF1365 domain-containing protein [Vibrio sp. SS-MA-C1-2]|uniref:DUF1365 domain-containing protein n=1 Tax=Vibrio sp. SS-MA-C1-2 TaxID=2908646 RepID=UPI001F26C49E|nr:DUF1365 domain-containing protein [Vibrio sp. SS-MA-C1-2]UJF18363.1 DUF1365 domain-containing protein [Vibrio sp. SS-MA-C1-2]
MNRRAGLTQQLDSRAKRTVTLSDELWRNSCLYRGKVRHRRFLPKLHRFEYSMFFLALDLDEIDHYKKNQGERFSWLSFSNQLSYFHRLINPLWFNSSDYVVDNQIKNTELSLKQRVWNKVREIPATSHSIVLNHQSNQGRVLFVGQVRCFGIYFSPINLYYCYNRQDQLVTLLAEVSNTPWNERHYYRIDMDSEQIVDKAFHVSPFMELSMRYHWKIKSPDEHFFLHLENHDIDPKLNGFGDKKESVKRFDATLLMKREPLMTKNIQQQVIQIPLMTVKIVIGIYWQALKIFLKKIPFVSHPER